MSIQGKKLPKAYYKQDDVVFLSKDLLGKYLMTKIGTRITGGMIVETEAYRGPEDKASHSYGGRRTKRNEVMYLEGGHAYVYLCYGIYHMFNVVTSDQNIPHAVLIRALIPYQGVEVMQERSARTRTIETLANGPGKLTKALGITLKHNGLSLDGSVIWIEDRGVTVSENDMIVGPRIGIDYAAEHAHLPWRFRMRTHDLKSDL